MSAETGAVNGGRDDAEDAGLRYVRDDGPGIRRERRGRGLRYLQPDGSAVDNPRTLARIRKIVIPPAWREVWIAPGADGHIQATGRDARGRKQYRYHHAFQAVREDGKYEHLLEFAATLPSIRRRVGQDMARRGLPREKVVATIVHLLDTTLIRVGNKEYAKQNGSFGLTTLRNRHVVASDRALRFEFEGKSGKRWCLKVEDRRVARIVKSCQELPGQSLFQYIDEGGERQSVSSTDVNAYLREISGREITAKDFRTWAGTVLAATALQKLEGFDSAAAAQRNVRAAIERVAARLGNTPTICRKCYVHPEVLCSYLDGSLALSNRGRASSLMKPDELGVLAFLRNRVRGRAGARTLLAPRHGGRPDPVAMAISPAAA